MILLEICVVYIQNDFNFHDEAILIIFDINNYLFREKREKFKKTIFDKEDKIIIDLVHVR